MRRLLRLLLSFALIASGAAKFVASDAARAFLGAWPLTALGIGEVLAAAAILAGRVASASVAVIALSIGGVVLGATGGVEPVERCGCFGDWVPLGGREHVLVASAFGAVASALLLVTLRVRAVGATSKK